ncbi:unnamed protein product [Closterium sp. NIES-54]
MTVKEALASWKGKAVKAAMVEEIRSLIGMGTWELVERPPRLNIMKKPVYGADYDETYAPVSSYVTLRIFLSIVAVLDLNLMQLDMKNAFLQSKLDRVLYMYQPYYFNDGTSRVCKLLKSLYGLKQSPLLWYKALGDVLMDAGWKKSQVDQALRFIDEERNGRTPKTPVSVEAYAELTFDDEEAQENQEEEYRQKVGSLQFATTTTRPDIAFGCSKLRSGLTVRSDHHWREVDRCLAYLSNTCDTALEFGGGPQLLKLVGYVDANDAGDKQTGRARAATSGKEGRRLCFLLAEFRQLDAGTPTILRVDNKLANTVAEGMGLKGNLKHMERRQAWLQHMVKRGKFSMKYIPTAEQPADFLTKALHYPAFIRCSVAIGQVRLVDVSDTDNDVQ